MAGAARRLGVRERRPLADGSRARGRGASSRPGRRGAAHHLGVSHSTIKHHLANARAKAGVATTSQLVWILAPRLPEPEREAEPHESVEPRAD